ncbi:MULTISPECIES: hypothetical protein [Thalassotalea]|uniref:hypothetical protein n=1 Tax=Thalassotalea TaxID=1518149 RepID=UPI0009438FB9|nr:MULTISPECIES: hypothetical protein [Thalassotalea]OKY25731.1 hypothetical protein BI291_15095 [Thalassotalea sp. PP2-459]
MSVKFWLKRACLVYAAVFILLFISECIKGHKIIDGLIFALEWSLLSTMVFISTRLYYVRKGKSCALCNDMPMKSDKGDI